MISRYLPSRFRRSVIAPRFLERLKKSQSVVGGPFKGMRYHGDAVCGAAAPKILGVYESELAPLLLRWSTIPFQHIIDVGAAEGYYAIGCAMLWPQATVTAFETSEEGRILFTRNVELNGLQSRVKIMGYCGREQLQAAMLNGQPSLVIVDIERGGKAICWNPETFPAWQMRISSWKFTTMLAAAWARPSRLGWHQPMLSKKCALKAERLGIFTNLGRHGDNQSVMDERTGANMQDMARAIEIWRDYLPANCRERLEQQGRRYWAGVALTLAQIFSLIMMLPHAQGSCALLKTYGTVASIVCVGCGWKPKCFFIAH